MDQILRPQRLDIDAESNLASLKWKHWLLTFENFLEEIKVAEDKQKLRILTNFLSPAVYQYVAECSTFQKAIDSLQELYSKPVSVIYARHQLASRRQNQEETIDQYLQNLKILARDCDFKAESKETNRDNYIRDAFISGLQSTNIRQRLLENTSLTLIQAHEKARSLELALKQSECYQNSISLNAVASENPTSQEGENDNNQIVAVANAKCFFCGRRKHVRKDCPARNAVCYLCKKNGHFASVCQSSKMSIRELSAPTSASTQKLYPEITASIGGLVKALVPATVNNYRIQALIDTGSTSSFISNYLVNKLSLKILHADGKVSMASTSCYSTILGSCDVNLCVLNHEYINVKLSILPDLCSDVIIGHDILNRHTRVEVRFGGDQSPLICGIAIANVEPVSLFDNLSPEVRPVSIKSRRYPDIDLKFIQEEVDRLLHEGIIEPSHSPWRAQVLVTSSDNHKKRLVIDYSRTINRYTLLDAYPLPRIDDLVNKIANYNLFSTVDLRSAYHQIPIKQEDRFYTAFEACGQLFQFKRIPFGVTNGVAAFQRVIDYIIRQECLKDTYAYLDDVTICGKDLNQHDENLKKFMNAVQKYNLTINMEKSKFSLTTIKLLGYVVSNKIIKPDPDRLQSLRDLPLPWNTASLRRTIGMFSHYSAHIYKFSDKILPLLRTKFPLQNEAIESFKLIKRDIEQAVVNSIDPDAPFTVETDASEKAIAATLSQCGRPVAFFSRVLSGSQLKYSAVEKEAHAIIEAIRKWRYYLIGRHFRLITDQKSVAFMFNNKLPGKIKNEKITRWRLELSCLKYDIIYRSGVQNITADAFSRTCSAIDNGKQRLLEIHELLCHPGVTKMYHWIKSKNLPYSIEDIRTMISRCRVCAEVKPRFHQHQSTLIKATSVFERLSMDFKGPLPSVTHNKYLLVIIDEYSRFPFAFPCPDMNSKTVIECLRKLFDLFGTPAYIHSDRGTPFMSIEMKTFLSRNNIAASRTTPYNPQGNGQVERYNGILWKTIELVCKSRNIGIECWESVLSNALHSIRSLLCTATNSTPHERMFSHPRRTSYGTSTPSWLLNPGPILMRKSNRLSKYQPIVEEVQLVGGNSDYAHVELPNGRNMTVSTRCLAPLPLGEQQREEASNSEVRQLEHFNGNDSNLTSTKTNAKENYIDCPIDQTELRRSSRIRTAPERLTYS